MKNPAVKTFLSAAVILLTMLIFTGALTYWIPGGVYDADTRTYEETGVRGIDPVRWIASPILVLFADGGIVVAVILLFLLVISGSLSILKEIGLIAGVIDSLISRFGTDRRRRIAVLTLFFMSLGAIVGIFEEVVPLVPIVVVLAEAMGMSVLVGLGVSILATGLGFAAAVTNPFTIGVAQKIADIPLFSGIGLRILVFASVYVLLTAYLLWVDARTRSEAPASRRSVSAGNAASASGRLSPDCSPAGSSAGYGSFRRPAIVFFSVVMAALLLVVVTLPFVESLSDLGLPIIGLLFLIAGVGCGLLSGRGISGTFRLFAKGVGDMAPAILLVLLATAIKYVLVEGQILGTVLYRVSGYMESIGSYPAVMLVFVVVMFLNFFIGSGSAKAFIVIPIVVPVMELLGLSAQLGVLAFQFGDGFSNVLYPTNAVLLISLGLARVSYAAWLRFVLPLQSALFVLALFWLWVGTIVGY